MRLFYKEDISESRKIRNILNEVKVKIKTRACKAKQTLALILIRQKIIKRDERNIPDRSIHLI